MPRFKLSGDGYERIPDGQIHKTGAAENRARQVVSRSLAERLGWMDPKPFANFSIADETAPGSEAGYGVYGCDLAVEGSQVYSVWSYALNTTLIRQPISGGELGTAEILGENRLSGYDSTTASAHRIVSLSSTRAITVYSSSGTSGRAAIAILWDITAGSMSVLDHQVIFACPSYFDWGLAKVDSTTALFIAVDSTNGGRAILISASGDSLSFGTANNWTTATGVRAASVMYDSVGDRFLAAWSDSDPSPDAAYLQALTDSWPTVSFSGSAVDMSGALAARVWSGFGPAVYQCPATGDLLGGFIYNTTTDDLMVTGINSSTLATQGSAQQLDDNNIECMSPHFLAIGARDVRVFWIERSTPRKVLTARVKWDVGFSSFDISASTELSLTAQPYGNPGTGGKGALKRVDDDYAVLAYHCGDPGSNYGANIILIGAQ